jgi:hypothetical protein
MIARILCGVFLVFSGLTCEAQEFPSREMRSIWEINGVRK